MYSFHSTEVKNKAFETPEGELVWQISETPDVLRTIAQNDVAILGADFCVIENDKLASIEVFRQFFPVWSTTPKSDEITWTEYCDRTLDESLSELSKFACMKEVSNSPHMSKFYVRPTFASPGDPILFVPRDKHDHARAKAAIAAGYPAVEPVLPQLLEWLQDTNWPVAQTLAPFLASIGRPLLPHLQRIFETDDDCWKSRVLWEILGPSKELTVELRETLNRIVQNPTKSEKEEELDIDSRDLLEKYGLA